MRTSTAYLSWSTVSGSLCMQESEEETLAVRVNETELRYKSVEEGRKLVPVCQFAWLMGITKTGEHTSTIQSRYYNTQKPI